MTRMVRCGRGARLLLVRWRSLGDIRRATVWSHEAHVVHYSVFPSLSIDKEALFPVFSVTQIPHSLIRYWSWSVATQGRSRHAQRQGVVDVLRRLYGEHRRLSEIGKMLRGVRGSCGR